jgi:hypothetical protein
MNTIEVFALNIQPRQIVTRIKCEKDDLEAVAYERNNFLKYLARLQEKGKTFENQVEAWNYYDSREIPETYEVDDTFLDDYDIINLEDRELEEIEREAWLHMKEPDWLSRLRQILLDMAYANSGNYNEFGGQL